MPDNIDISFRPSVAVVIGILAFMFALTFLLLVYAKFCHIAVSSDPIRNGNNTDEHGHHQGPIPTRSTRFSGIDKTLIESLPFFKFSTLKGSKQGLECAVCLSKFEDTEVLRLLPKCKHAFHINCVDQWLESHSSCPLCRHKVHAEDLSIFKLSNSSRLSRNSSSLDHREDPNFELFVRREQDDHGSSRFSIGSSFRKIEKVGKKDDHELLLINQDIGVKDEHYDDDEELAVDDHNKQFHKFNHKIIISDIVYKNRWSDVNSSDLMFLNSEMLNLMSSKRFSSFGTTSTSTDDHQCKNILSSNEEKTSTTTTTTTTTLMKIREEIERKRMFESKISTTRSTTTDHGNSISGHLSSSLPSTSDEFLISKRSMSEITNFSRFGDVGMKNKIRESTNSSSLNEKEERMKRIWFPIARRTVQWIAGRQRRPKQSDQNSRLFSIV
ncbi:zinc finger protein [Macleaya cordata]|uniref:RING-type E3 ubiquitin transferase n=1 Tax=Macleaya cordata TaxID=56857 RepID=A0A200RC33_MACCD|nr:zinc finger protein [Macleaya cordata]